MEQGAHNKASKFLVYAVVSESMLLPTIKIYLPDILVCVVKICYMKW